MQPLRPLQREISVGLASVILGVVLGLLIVVIGYGNDYASCVRTKNTRASNNQRIAYTADFWGTIADVRSNSASISAKFLARLDEIDGENPKVKKVVEDFLTAQQTADGTAADRYSSYANGLRLLRSKPVDCLQLPPPSD